MATVVNLFYHRGLVAAPILTRSQDTKDSVFMLEQPYLETAVSITATSTPQTTAAAPQKTAIVSIEVEDGHAVRCEMLPPGRVGTASAIASPKLTGQQVLQCGPGWTISIVEAA